MKLKEKMEVVENFKKPSKEEITPMVAVPFNGEMVFVRVRRLNQAQLYACGGNNLSLIELDSDKKFRAKKKHSFDDIVMYSKAVHDICKEALVSPTYSEILDIARVGLTEESFKKQTSNLYEKLATVSDNTKEFEKLAFEIKSLEVKYYLLLPDDFTGAIVNQAMEIDGSDIKKVTEETLYTAAALAVASHNAPSDHINGVFSDFMKDDINKRALVIYAKKQKDLKNVNRRRNNK